MTVSSTANKISYAGDGATAAFAFPYYFLADGDLTVTLRDALAVETVQILTADYTVIGVGNQSGGTVTMMTAPASGETLIIQREVALTQGADYVANDSFPAETHETALDRLTMAVQQLDETLGRKLGVPTSDTAPSLDLPIDSDRAGKFLGFDAGGNPIAAAGASANLTPVSAFMDTLLDDADAATARATLGALENVLTTRGDLPYEGVNGEARLGVGTNGQVLTSDGTDPTWAIPATPASATDTVEGILETATQTEQEIGSAVNKIVTPGRQHFHQSAAKAWVNFNGTGTVAINDSYNVTSITDNGIGNYTVNLTTAFSTANYAGIGTTSNGSHFMSIIPAGVSASAWQIQVNSDTGVSIDPTIANAVFFGDQ